MICKCPACEKDGDFGDDATGRVVECPGCGEFFLVDAAETGEYHCPKCNVGLEEGTMVCMNCGFNIVAGAYLRTVVSQEKEELPGAMKVLNFFGDLVPGVFRPFVLLGALICCCGGVAVMVMGSILISWQVVFSGIACAAFGLILYAQGVALILCGHFEILSRASVDFESKHWYLFCLVVFGPFLAIILGIIYATPATPG